MHPALIFFIVLCSVFAVAVAVYFSIVATSSKSRVDALKAVASRSATPDPRSIAFIGLAQNVILNIDNMKRFVERLKATFPNSSVWVGENGSTDGSAHEIYKCNMWRAVDLSNVKFETNRIERMASLRNELQTRVLLEENPELLCVLDWDLDFTLTPVCDWPNAFNALKTDDTLAAVSGIALLKHPLLPHPYFYDTFAFRHRKEDPFQQLPWSKWLNLSQIFGNVDRSFTQRVGNNFGGVCVYRTAQVRGIEYKARESMNASVVCEHVLFQNQIKGDVLMSGALLSLGEHSRQRKTQVKVTKELKEEEEEEDEEETALPESKTVEMELTKTSGGVFTA